MSTIARWQGEVDVTLRDHDRRLDDQQSSISRLWARIGKLEVGQGRLMVGMGVVAALGSMLGGGVVTAVVYLVTH